MTSAAKKILEDALSLPADDREKLVQALSDSLTPEPVDLSPEWTAEVARRIAEVENGEVKTVPWTEVEARIKRSLGQE